MSIQDKEMAEVKALSIAITKLLPTYPRNIGIPLVALEIVKGNYLEWVRRNLAPNELEKFELLQRQMQMDVERFIEHISNDMSDLK
jgi:hypothetical protein